VLLRCSHANWLGIGREVQRLDIDELGPAMPQGIVAAAREVRTFDRNFGSMDYGRDRRRRPSGAADRTGIGLHPAPVRKHHAVRRFMWPPPAPSVAVNQPSHVARDRGFESARPRCRGPNKTINQNIAATAKPRTIVGLFSTSMKLTATTTTISTPGIITSGRSYRPNGRKLAADWMPPKKAAA
jgi:hypothetical protein